MESETVSMDQMNSTVEEVKPVASELIVDDLGK